VRNKHLGRGKRRRTAHAQFQKRYKPSLLLVPQGEGRASQALKEREPTEARELWMIAQNLWETIEGDATGQMVHMIYPDIAREPARARGNL
jgi:hypothetical protein